MVPTGLKGEVDVGRVRTYRVYLATKLGKWGRPLQPKTILQVVYRSPSWRQSDASVANNLSGLFVLSPDGSTIAFSRYPPDRVLEVYVLPTSGGDPTMIFKSSNFGRVESWSPDGRYIVVSVDNSTPAQRMRLIDPRTKTVIPVNTGPGYVELLAWMVA